MVAIHHNDPVLSPQENQAWQQFVGLLKQAFEEDIHDPIFQLLLTHDERDALATRVRIIQELMRGEISQRELKSLLGVGIATITRGSNGLKSASPKVKEWLEGQLLTD